MKTVDMLWTGFFAFGVFAFLVFNGSNVVTLAKGAVSTGVGLSSGLATVGRGN